MKKFISFVEKILYLNGIAVILTASVIALSDLDGKENLPHWFTIWWIITSASALIALAYVIFSDKNFKK
jgi:hypothetical protein